LSDLGELLSAFMAKKLCNTGQTRVEDYGLVCLNIKAAYFSKKKNMAN
jgi:hypothetical protein